LLPESEYSTLDHLLAAVRRCRVCADQLPLGPRPVLRASLSARMLIVGQAPGLRVHRSGIPWDDASGKTLRTWMGIGEEQFYDECRIAIIPIGYCYPGKGRSGDLPPRKECAQLWLGQLLAKLPQIELTLLIGLHAQQRFLAKRRKATLTQTVRAWREYQPAYLPLPHPSARNTPWFQRNPWFGTELLPALRKRVESELR